MAATIEGNIITIYNGKSGNILYKGKRSDLSAKSKSSDLLLSDFKNAKFLIKLK